MKIEEMAAWEDIQNEWVISHIDAAGNRVNSAEAKPQGLAEAMGVAVETAAAGEPHPQQHCSAVLTRPAAAAGYEGEYNPYDMEDNQAYAGEFESVGGDMQALIQGQGVRSAFLSYGQGGEDPDERDEDPTGGLQARVEVPRMSAAIQEKAKRPKSSAGSRAKSASGRRPGSAKKKNRDSNEVLQGLGTQGDESEVKDKIAVPQARGLVSKRPPSAKARPKA